MDMSCFKYPVKTKSMKRREANDKKLLAEFGAHDRFQGLSWYTTPSTGRKTRSLVYVCLCGRQFELLPSSVRSGYNPELLCPHCVTPIRRRGQGSINPKYLTEPYPQDRNKE